MTDERLKGHRIGLNGSPRQGLSRQRSGAQDLPLPRAALGAFPVSRGAFPSSLRAFRQPPSRSARSSPRGHRVFGNGRAPRISSGWSAHDDRPASPDIGVRDRSIRLSVEPTPSGPALGRTHPGTSPCRWMPVVRRLLLSNAIDDLRLLPGEREPRDLASLPLLKGAVPGARDPTAERHVSRPRPITSEESGSLLCLCDRYERGPRRAGQADIAGDVLRAWEPMAASVASGRFRSSVSYAGWLQCSARCGRRLRRVSRLVSQSRRIGAAGPG
jgi:hypothetical protein